MMKLVINSTSQELRKIFTSYPNNCVTSLETPEGYVLLGGTFSQRAWLAGDKSQGLTVEKRKTITDKELKELRDWDGHVYVFEDTLYLLSLNPTLNNIKYPLTLLETFSQSEIEITDLR